MDRLLTRRRFLSTTALAGAGAVAALLLHRRALAFSAMPASAETQRLYLSACSAKDGAYHRQLVADVKAELNGRATDAQIEAAIAAATCPLCGCPITTS